MNTPDNKIVVITGGSSGIGYSTADLLLSKNAKVCLLARNLQKLEEAKAALEKKYPGKKVSIYPCDITRQDQVKQAVNAVAADHGGIEWLINNAGIGETGRFESQPVSVMQQVMDTNYWGPVYMTLEALPWLSKSKGAAIAFVSSVAGYVGLFGYTHYVPSKFAITGLAESCGWNLEITISRLP